MVHVYNHTADYWLFFYDGAIVVVIVWYLDLQLPVQSVPITTKVVSSNLSHGKVYLIQHYVIKLVSDFVVFSGYSGFLHQQNWMPRYNWNIVESGVKHHKSCLTLNWCRFSCCVLISSRTCRICAVYINQVDVDRKV
jgi:hypothetical protein